MPFVYILKNEKGSFYIGSTVNLERRIKQHLQGNTITTKRMRAFELVFSQEYKELVDARKIEYKLKKLKRKDYIANIIKEGYIKMTA
ncbi:MAG: GIY-YIG nuclease family protein [Candidatus Paceibacterota bacterium]